MGMLGLWTHRLLVRIWPFQGWGRSSILRGSTLDVRQAGYNQPMIILGIVLLVLGLLLFHPLFVIGAIILVIGLVLALAGGFDRPVGGRRHWY